MSTTLTIAFSSSSSSSVTSAAPTPLLRGKRRSRSRSSCSFSSLPPSSTWITLCSGVRSGGFYRGGKSGVSVWYRTLGFGFESGRNYGFRTRAVGNGTAGGDEEKEAEEKLRETIEKSKKVLAMQDSVLQQIVKRRELISSIGREIVEEQQVAGSNVATFDTVQANESKIVKEVTQSDGTVPYEDKNGGIVLSRHQEAGIVLYEGKENGIVSLEHEEEVTESDCETTFSKLESDSNDLEAKKAEDFTESKIHPPLPIGETTKDIAKDVIPEELVETKVETVHVSEPAVDDAKYAEENNGSAPLAGVNVMNIILVAAECAPWSKTGGLGDVAGSLPKALARRGHRVMVVAPRYGDYAEALNVGVRKYYKAAGQDLEVSYYHAYIDGVDFVFIDAPPFRHRENNIYGGDRMEILKRMILFCKVAVEVPWNVPCGGTCYGDGNLVFIANDWHTALLPVYLKAYYRDNGLMQYTRAVLVIHNISYQGRGPVDDFSYMDLPEHYIEHFKLYDPLGGDHANIFAAGLKAADRVVTVSHGYLWELKTLEGGWGLHEIINHNHWKVHGIVNGIDPRVWNPQYDLHLQSDGYTNYSLQTVDAGKRQCKAALQQELGLAVREEVPVIAFIGRLDYQKGVDLIAEAMPWIASQDVQLIMLGTGRADLEEMLKKSEGQHHEKVRGWVGFSVRTAHRMTAGADILVMPSRFEPCGLNQLYAMMYGTIPVVHAVGGLRETVAPFDPLNDTGLGWTFDRAESGKLIDALSHCLSTYWYHKDSWRGLQRRGMSQDLSWDNAAQQYEEVLVAAKYQW